MADIVAGSVTYTVDSQARIPGYGNKTVVKMVFGDGALQYRTATGVPLTKGNMGCPNVIKSFKLIEAATTSGYVWDFDKTAEKLKCFYGNYDAGDGPLIELPDTTAIAAQEVWAEVDGW